MMRRQMSMLVEQQDETIATIETQAGQVNNDMEQGLKYTEQAVIKARKARRKKWICFWLTSTSRFSLFNVVQVILTRFSQSLSSLSPLPSSSVSSVARASASKALDQESDGVAEGNECLASDHPLVLFPLFMRLRHGRSRL